MLQHEATSYAVIGLIIAQMRWSIQVELGASLGCPIPWENGTGPRGFFLFFMVSEVCLACLTY